MEELLCSNRACRKPIMGSCCMLANGEVELKWSEVMEVYTPFDGGPESVVLHPNCFKELFDELLRQEGHTIFTIIIAQAEDIIAAMTP